MGAVVAICWICFAISTEIGVVTYGAFVTVAHDVGLIALALAKWTVTENAMMFLATARRWRNDLVNWDKAMSWVNLACAFDAG